MKWIRHVLGHDCPVHPTDSVFVVYVSNIAWGIEEATLQERAIEAMWGAVYCYAIITPPPVPKYIISRMAKEGFYTLKKQRKKSKPKKK